MSKLYCSTMSKTITYPALLRSLEFKYFHSNAVPSAISLPGRLHTQLSQSKHPCSTNSTSHATCQISCSTPSSSVNAVGHHMPSCHQWILQNRIKSNQHPSYLDHQTKRKERKRQTLLKPLLDNPPNLRRQIKQIN